MTDAGLVKAKTIGTNATTLAETLTTAGEQIEAVLPNSLAWCSFPNEN